MIKIKPGAEVRGIRPEILFAIMVAEGIWGELVVTEVTGGKHKSGSLHYVGLACDIRINDLSEDKISSYVSKLKDSLGLEYDVVRETSHVHIEYQPKE